MDSKGNKNSRVTIVEPPPTSGDESASSHVKYESVWKSMPRSTRIKRSTHVPKHHDATKISFCTRYNLLQCKEMKLLCRKKKIFLAQILLPIIIVAFLNFRTLILKEDIEANAYTPFVLRPVNMEECDGTIYIAPNNTLIRRLIGNLNNQTTTSNMKFSIFPKPISEIGKSIPNSCGTVHFTNLVTSNRMPNEPRSTKRTIPIRYQIRLRTVQWSLLDSETKRHSFFSEPSKWSTDRIFSKDLVVGPRNKHDNEGGVPGYVSEGFLYLQRRIDVEIIKMIYKSENHGNEYNNDYFLQLERFPFPAFESTNMVYLIQHELPITLLLAFMFQILSCTYLAVKEKETGAKAFLKLFGISNFTQWLPVIVKVIFQYTLVNIAITFLLCSKWYLDGKHYIAIINDSSSTLIFMILQLVTFNTCALGCLISVFFLNEIYATSIAAFCWIFLNLPFLYFDLGNFIQNPLWVKYVSSIFAQTGLRTSLQLVAAAESNGDGVQWSTAFDNDFGVGHVLCMLLAGGVACLLFTIYIENICPISINKHVIPLPKSYFLQGWWWKSQLPPDNSDAPDYSSGVAIATYFEPDPTYLKLELQVKSLSKCYQGDVGIFNVTMNFYEGEITVILGLIGSGKSTIFNLISGLIPATRGAILLNNINVRTEARYIKYNLGICPEETFLYDYLTVEEHISLYAQLKGFQSIYDAIDESENLIRALKLRHIRSKMGSTLNVSQKRLVHIAIAFSAGSKVVVLDEPTANISASTKRIIWKFLQKEKSKRTIVVLTSNTEETNFIADRVAILVHGEIQCKGSLGFLKSTFGGGYHLKVFKGARFKHFDVTNLVKHEIPYSKVNGETEEYISYYLPGEYAPQFPIMFQQLEQHMTRYDIDDIQISYVTMEEVFKKVCKLNESEIKIEYKKRRSRKSSSFIPENFDVNKSLEKCLVGFGKENLFSWLFNQFNYLLKINWKVTIRRSLWHFLPYVIAILLVISICQIIDENPFDKNLPALPSNLDGLKKVIKTPTFLVQCEEQFNGNDFCEIVNEVAGKYAQVKTTATRDVNVKIEELILETYHRKRTLATSDLVLAVNTAHGTSRGISSKVTILFDNQPLHLPFVAINFAGNLMLKDALTSASKTNVDYFITTENFPLEYEVLQLLGLAEDYWSAGFYLGLAISWAMTFVIPIYIVFPINETYFRHIQKICGVNMFVYWFAKFIWDFIQYHMLVALILVILDLTNICELLLPDNLEHFIRAEILFSTFGFTSIGLVYCMVPLFKTSGSGLTGYIFMWLIFFFTGPFILSCVLITNDQDRDSHTVSNSVKVLLDLLLIFPNTALGLGIFNVYAKYKFSTECTKEIRDSHCHSNLTVNHGCCHVDGYFHHDGGLGIGENIVALFFVGFLAHFLTIFMETDAFRRIQLRLKHFWFCKYCFEKKKPVTIVDDDSLPEINFGDNASVHSMEDDDEKYKIILSNIFHQTKNGSVLLDIPKLRLKEQECTCCYGLKGSGQITLLQILAGLVTPDLGDVKINKKSLLRNYSQYIKRISYSPHHDHATFLPELTGYETLSLCAILSRIPERTMKSVVTNICLKLNLMAELENRIKDFSPGTLKKLAIAVGIINNPEILIFEEPTAEVDQDSRAQIIKALVELKKTSSLLISTSDMEICEQLADRVLVFGRTGGRIQCYGSPSYLKSTYCDNITITATLIPDVPQHYLPGNTVELGWDYEKDDNDVLKLNDNLSDEIWSSGSGPSNNSIQSEESKESSNISVKAVKDTSYFVTDISNSKDKVKYYKRAEEPEKQPEQSNWPKFSLFSANKNKVYPEADRNNQLSVIKQPPVKGSVLRGPSPSTVRGPYSSIASYRPRFSFFSKNEPKYEYHSSSSSSETFTSTTVMQHWQVELIPIINFIETQFPEAELINIYPCFVQYLLRNEARLSDVFEKMAIAKRYLDLEHFSAGHMSLEQFFLHYIEGQIFEEN